MHSLNTAAAPNSSGSFEIFTAMRRASFPPFFEGGLRLVLNHLNPLLR